VHEVGVMLFEFIYEMLIPYARTMREGDEFPPGTFVLCTYPRRYRPALYVAWRLPSWQWMRESWTNRWLWHRLQVGWCSDAVGGGLGFFAQWAPDRYVRT
jgi:hypothetical protein